MDTGTARVREAQEKPCRREESPDPDPLLFAPEPHSRRPECTGRGKRLLDRRVRFIQGETSGVVAGGFNRLHQPFHAHAFPIKQHR